MRKRYFIGEKEYTAEQVAKAAKKNGVSFDEYISGSRIDVREEQSAPANTAKPKRYFGGNTEYTEQEVANAAKEHGVSFDEYLKRSGMEVREEQSAPANTAKPKRYFFGETEYTEQQVANAAKKNGVSFDEYLRGAHMEVKEEQDSTYSQPELLKIQKEKGLIVKYTKSQFSTKEILNIRILQNTVQDYSICLAILLFAFLFKKVLSGWITKWVIQWVISSKRTFDRQQLKTLVLQPVQMFLLVLFIIIGFNRLHFPDALNIDIYKTDLHSIADAAAKGFLIISFIWLCNRCITFSANLLQKITAATPDKRDDQLVQLFREVLRIIVWIGGLLMIIKFSFGFPLSSMLTGLSIVGAALALAFRDSLENLIASFIIFFEKPFTTGDLVKTDKVQGYIVKIGLRSILLHTLEKTYITIPNKKMSENVVENISKRSARHASHTITIASSATAIQIENCLQSIKKALEIRPELEDVAVFLTDAHHTGYQITIEYFVSIEWQIPAFLALKQTILLEIGTILLELGLKTYDQPTFWVKETEK